MKNLFALSLIASLTGCAFDAQSDPEAAWTVAADVANAEAPDVEFIDGSSFREGPDSPFVLVDLRRSDLAVGVDRGTSELGRISLLCPNGITMRWEEWTALDAELAEELAEADDWVGIGATERLARTAIDAATEDDLAEETCEPACRPCPDGAWVCTNRCAERRRTRPARSPNTGSHRPHPASEDPSEPGSPPSSRSGSDSNGNSSGTPSNYGASPGGHPGSA